jgi:signal transduction histidine kinase
VILATHGREPDTPKWATVLEVVPVLEKVLRSEYDARLATASAAVANETARQARSLAEALFAVRIQLERALRESKLNAEEREKAQVALRNSEKLATAGRMAATIAHEINNPLEAITNLLYLICGDTTLQRQTKQYAESADRELQRVAAITRKTLAFCRDTSAPAPVDIGQIIEDVLMVFRPSASRKGTEIQFTYAPHTTIVGAKGELQQIFTNPISNALDACGRGDVIRVEQIGERLK